MTSRSARRRQYGSAAFVAATFACAFAALAVFFVGPSLVFCAVVAGACALCLERVRRVKIRKLEQKLQTASRVRMNTIFVNGVRAGEIDEADYIAVKLDAALDPRNYVRQFGAIAKLAAKCVAVTAVVIPLGLFWWLIFGTYFAPEATTANLGSIYHLLIQANNPSDLYHLLASVAEAVLNIGATATLTSFFALVFHRESSGGISSFRKCVHRRLRQMANCAADGDVHVEPGNASQDAQSVFLDRTRLSR
ncbi:hypothetical protein [Paraburkholderia sp. BL10I2N1]|uniref:hypothetical protein n=1 Tax=Paraburkholderia sp. BL10I2N1 TaxID=1938796 RepID=UPI001060AB9F|nr:hypothetical protein [Paraburkholderia sp. BL10I2N1]TDN59060.1 hypothetical protein B0G77_8248 [Paraburkholderia sp. BL10I2N1]